MIFCVFKMLPGWTTKFPVVSSRDPEVVQFLQPTEILTSGCGAGGGKVGISTLWLSF
jgi:hypothetical protein